MLVCERCGYGLYRTCTQTSARRLYYYRCIGSDAYRLLKGAVCDNPPVRQDQLDAVVWKEVMQLLEDPHIIQDELNRRLEAAKNADPLKQREDQLRRDHARLAKGMDRLLTAYQESLVSLEQLRCRMPELRQQDQAIKSELQSLETVAGDQAKYLRLVETLADFHARLQARAETLDVSERQKILRLLVKEVLVGRETITIRHSIRMPNSAPDPSGTPRPPHAPEPPPMPNPTHVIVCVQAVISPLLANIYLHYVLDQWVVWWRKRYAFGDMVMVRYADDFVIGFEHRKGSGAIPGATAGAAARVRAGTASGKDAPDTVRAICHRSIDSGMGKGSRKPLTFWVSRTSAEPYTRRASSR